MAPDHYVRAALNSECAIVASTRRGRNAAINTAAVKLGSFVAAGALDRNEVVARLFDAALACGYIAKDGAMQARASILSGMSAGLRQPRAIPEARQPSAAPRRPQPAPVMDVVSADTARDAARTARAAAIWNEGGDPRGTIAEAYLHSRGLDLDEDLAGTVLRWNPRTPWRDDDTGELRFVPCMLSLLRCVTTDAPQAVQRTWLDAEGRKIARKHYGPARGAAIKIDADETVTSGLHVAEGCETAMTARQFGLRPAWAAGSAGAIRSFPVLPGVEALTLLAEHDDANARAVEECAWRWTEAGREVHIIRSTRGSDLNDCIKQEVA